jgi:transcriptional regulator with XRE-family HTH domain
MATRITRLDAARTVARAIRNDLGREIRLARLAAGTSQREAGARVGISRSQWGRIESGELQQVNVDQLSRACSSVGLRLHARAVPDADPALDAGQLALLERFRRQLPPSIRMATEVPLPIPGDRRAWDGFLRLGPTAIGIEAEARVRDAQALDRRCALKRRDGGVDVVILLVADTPSNRNVLALHREALRANFPLDTRSVLAALRVARAPAASGIVVL